MGRSFDTQAEPPIQFEGFAARHDLAQLPHLAFREGGLAMEDVLGREEYWLCRKRDEGDVDGIE
jgi:hypothetical protein